MFKSLSNSLNIFCREGGLETEFFTENDKPSLDYLHDMDLVLK